MKPCENCNRVDIGDNFSNVHKLRATFGVILIYLPALLLPFILLAGGIVRLHLFMVGAKNIKRLRDFMPNKQSHRYNLKNQITYDNVWWSFWSRMKAFWIINCTHYCPKSVAIFQWITYMVQIVENFWCPFNHDRKHTYTEGAIDKSFWHGDETQVLKLHEDDRNDPKWS